MSTATIAGIRWPLAPLLDAIAHPPITTVAVRVGVSVRTVWRWHHNGLTDHQADRVAIALELHPANIWHDWHNPT